MPEIVEHLRRKFPDVTVSLTVSSYLEVAQRVRNRQADIGLTGDALSIGDLETVADSPPAVSASARRSGCLRWPSPSM